jgi:N-succinyl-L-ornithine transcarbamylase
MDVITMNMAEGWKWEMEEGAVMKFDTAEHIKEAAGVISSYADVIGIRTFPALKNKNDDYQDKVIKTLIKYSHVPVVNMESAILHPLQSLTDAFTIKEKKPSKDLKIVLSWAPHPKALPQAVSNSFLQWMHMLGNKVTITHPEGYELDPAFTMGHSVDYDQDKAFKEADVVYVKNWSSVNKYGEILSKDASWMITKDKLDRTNKALLMHCLPVRRNVVISDDALDSSHAVVIDQAANRTVAAQAVLHSILSNN